MIAMNGLQQKLKFTVNILISIDNFIEILNSDLIIIHVLAGFGNSHFLKIIGLLLILRVCFWDFRSDPNLNAYRDPVEILETPPRIEEEEETTAAVGHMTGGNVVQHQVEQECIMFILCPRCPWPFL